MVVMVKPVGHGLGVAPDAIILKARGATQNWKYMA